MIFKNFNLIFPDRIEQGTLKVRDGSIRQISNHSIPEDEEVRDGRGLLYLSPGFIDIHIHGAGGSDTMDATFDALNTISQTISRTGTTSFLPTTMTEQQQRVQQAVQAVKTSLARMEGAQILGIHLEGPFLSPNAAGAQNPDFLSQPSAETFQKLVQANEDLIKIVTLAPEVEGGLDLIRFLSIRGIRSSLGHTAADYETAKAAIQAGASHATHLFNAMPPLHHREPGVIGAVMDSESTAEIIADGIHIAYPVIRMILKALGTDRIILVSDAMMACGMPDGRYSLGGQEVLVKENQARLASGTLAGSVLTLDRAVHNIHANSSYPLHEIVRMATLNPARVCGVERHKGQLADGADADLIIFDDAIEVKEVYVMGRRIK